MAASAEWDADVGGVHLVASAHRDLGDVRLGLYLEEDGDLHGGHGLEQVDDALELLHVRLGIPEHGQGDLRPDQLAAVLGAHPPHRHPLEAHLRDGARLVALEGDPAGIGPQRGQIRAQAQRGLVRVLMPEAAGVREQGGVEVGGRVPRDLRPHGARSSWYTT